MISTRWKSGFVFLTVSMLLVPPAFMFSAGTQLTTSSRTWALYNKQDDDDSRRDATNWNDFLDRPFFDPSRVSKRSPLRWFADLVQTDYETAEALFASSFLFVLVILTQEILRMQLYGDDYVPFHRGGGIF